MNRYNMELDRVTVPESAVDSLMERAAAPRKKTGWLRPMAMAACIVLLCSLSVLAGTVFADEQWLLGSVQDEELGKQFFVEATYGGTVFSEERLRTWIADAKRGTRVKAGTVHSAEYTFDSFEALEKALGVDLLETPLKKVAGCYFEVSLDEENALYIDVFYRVRRPMEDENIYIEAYLAPFAGTKLRMLQGEPQKKANVSTFTQERLGVTAYLVENQSIDGVSRGYFTKDGIAYRVTVRGSATELKNVLNSME